MSLLGDEAVTLVCQGYHPWSPLWKRNQSLFWALATRSWTRRALFQNPIADWRLLWGPGAYQTEPQAQAARRALVPQRVGPRHWAWTPMGPLPFGRMPAVRRCNRALRGALRQRLIGPGARIVILNDPFADAADVADLTAGAALVVFDLSDDFAAFDHGGDDGGRDRVVARLAELAQRADAVLAVNAALADRYRAINPQTYLVPNACHFERFARCAERGAPRAPLVAELAGQYRRVVGYYGWIVAHRMDLLLLNELIPAHPDWAFVFVGPSDPATAAQLRSWPNARLWDTVPHEALPALVSGFDVCVLPHAVNAHTAGNDPLKLYEYLASGKPVVATPIAGVERFGAAVETGRTAAEFGAAITRAITSDSDAARNARQELGRANSWTIRADQVERLLARLELRAPIAPERVR